MARTVSIGAEAFYELREESAFLVDKTDFIKEWWNASFVREWFDDYTQYYGEFVSSFLKNDLEGMNRLLTKVLLNCMSYHDGGRNMGVERIKDQADRRTPENFYHGLVLGMLVDQQGRYDLTSNRESGNGRYDIMLEPLEGARWEDSFHPDRPDSSDRSDRPFISSRQFCTGRPFISGRQFCTDRPFISGRPFCTDRQVISCRNFNR